MINRKIALSAMSILTALGMTAGATFAVFTSAASNNGNTFGTGTLTLNINGAGGSTSSPVFTVPTAKPGDEFDGTFNLLNSGTVNASSVQVSSINIGGNSALADNLTLVLYLDNGGTLGQLDGTDTVLGTGHLTDPSWAGHVLSGLTIPAGITEPVRAHLIFDSGAGEGLQGTSTVFNINLQANQ